ncbi:MAG: hypothetical protein JNK82_39450 [Myxococcaceae bacterium]|nr:hypothetical protein [Myxococcaceae bacterium]
MTWERGPVIEKSTLYEARLVRRDHQPGTLFTGDKHLLARAAELRGAGAPWLQVLDAGEGWLVTELDLSHGWDEVAHASAIDESAGGSFLLPPQVLVAAEQVMAAAVRAGRDPRCIRFDWRGGMRLRPLAPTGGTLASAVDALWAGQPRAPAFPEWDENRITAHAMLWVTAHFRDQLPVTQEVEGWLETPLPAGLEGPLVADLDDAGAWRVVSDALLEQGHPRGALMALQLSKGDATATRNHLRRHPWLLPVAGHFIRLVLERGFVARLEVEEHANPRALPTLLKHPALRFLRTIQLSMGARALTSYLDAIEDTGHRSVREVVLPRVKSPERYRGRLQAVLPRLVAVDSDSEP